VEFFCVKGCREAKDLIAQYHPVLVFVDVPIWSKSHADIVNMSKGADQNFNIIVVGPLPDIEQYVSAIERGAFNYVAPPFFHETLTPVVHSAAMDARERRESLERVLLSFEARG
jgi:DNA-binding NtrC family response regulator